MAGKVFDLDNPATALPDDFIVDTNVIIERIWSSILPRAIIQDPVKLLRESIKSRRATEFFDRLLIGDATGFITPTVYSEIVHVVIGNQLRQFGSRQQPAMSGRDVSKRFPEVIRACKPVLEHVSFFLSTSGLKVMHPGFTEYVEIESTFESQLIETCCSYGLDSADAMILLEAQRLGIDAIVSMDLDMQRASADFDIYAWPNSD